MKGRIARTMRTVLRSFGWDIVRYVEMPVNPFDVMRLVVQEQLKKDPAFYFVQIGAHDGIRNDPLRHIVAEHRIPGLLVEPLPDVFERLRANYAGFENLRFERCAVGPHDGDVSLFRVRADAPYPAWAQGIASFDRKHLLRFSAKDGIPDVEAWIEEVKVPCRTLASLLRQHSVQTVSLLQVDTEGFDCEIVKMAIDAGIRPPIINYESIHCDPHERAACKRLLGQTGYDFVDVGRDTLAVRWS